MADIDVPVLIVGGGIAGLSSSLMLREAGVESLLVERHPGTSIVPKAHIIHSRTMEIFAQYGLEEAVRTAGSPPETFSRTSWYTSLKGDEVWDKQVLASLPSWSQGPLADYYASLTAHPMANLPQNLLEPIVRARAEELSGIDRVRFNHELVHLSQDGDSVQAAIQDRASGETYSVSAKYLVAADGGKSIGARLGIDMIGPEPFVDIVSMTFEADLSEYLQEDHSLIRLFLQPDPDGSVKRFSIVANGPDVWDRHCTHWRSGVVLPVGSELSPDDYTVEDGTRDLLELFKTPELEIRNLQMNHWLIESVVAEKFSSGRVFLVGDAAHRHSPMGGLGLNTGVQDAHNLAWKLAAVLKNHAGEELLESYEGERRPVAVRRVDFATFAFFSHFAGAAGFGMLAGGSEEYNREVLEALFSDTITGRTRRSHLNEILYSLRREFQHADIDLGYEYADSSAVTPDGTLAPPRDADGTVHEQVARPGHRLPHAWLELGGQKVSTHDLLRIEGFVLLTDDQGDAWVEAAKALRMEIGVPLTVHPIGRDSSLVDREGRWTELRGHEPGGTVLVRPDGHVAFRAISAVTADEARDQLQAALLRSLGRTSSSVAPAH